MSTETVLVSEVIFATRQRLYEAWLDSEEHSAFTAEAAEIEPVVGGIHTTFAGYATGQTLALEPHRRIIQTWRTTEFPAGAPDSRLEITFEDTLGGTLITLLHTGIPSGQSDQYREAWLKYYFAPMKVYFADENEPAAAPEFDPSALSPAPARKIGRPNKIGRSKPKAKPTAKAKAKPAVKARARKPATKASVKAKAKPVTKAKAKPATKAKAKPATKAKAKPATKAKAKARPTTKAKAKPATKKPAKRKR
jgi:uncharacterized protein YndB with AHSA1/START domain